MPSCCYGDEFGSVFTPREAEGTGRLFLQKGLTGSAAKLVSALRSRGLDGATVLEVGGGVGDIQVALLEAGAARAINVELSPSWEDAAKALLTQRGLTERVDRVIGDFVDQADAMGGADMVVLHRVVCCYPDWRAMLSAATAKTGRLLGLTFPAARWWNRLALGLANLLFRLRGLQFRAYVHPPEEMIRLIEAGDLAVVHDQAGLVWRTLVFERAPSKIALRDAASQRGTRRV